MVLLKNMNSTIKKIAYSIWHLRAKLFCDFPLPCVLPYGSLYLAYGDGMGFMFFFKRPYEENERKFVQKFLKLGMTFFDVGANQGFYTLLAAKQVGQDGKVFSFEPVPSQIKKLRKNIKINRFRNVTTEPLAIGSKSGRLNMYVCSNGDEALSSLRVPAKDAYSPKEIINVQVTTLDDYVDESKILSVDFIKIDVEGGELEVLKGAAGILKNMRPVIMCEVQDKRTAQWGYRASDICKFVDQYDYSWFDVVENGLLKISGQKDKHDISGENLIAIPKEKINSLAGFL